MLSQVLTSNIIATTLLLILLTNYLIKRIIQKFYKFFMLMLSLNIVQSLIDVLWISLSGVSFWGAIPFGYVINSLSYLNTIFFAKVWFDFNYVRCFGSRAYRKDIKLSILVDLPIIAVFITVIVNIFVPILFVVKEGFVYERKIGYYCAFAFTYLYLIAGFIVSCAQRKTARRQLLGSIIWFIIPVIIASILQSLFSGTSIIWIGTAIGLVLLYLNLQDEMFMLDELSGLFTRQSMNNYVKDKIACSNSKSWLVGIMLDVDKFKQINDTFGHCVGDNVISSIGNVLNSSITSNSGMAARYGGDEFIVLAMISDKAQIQAIMNTISENLDKLNQSKVLPLQISISMGYSEYQKNDNIDRFINRMDKEMYKKKPNVCVLN